MARSNQEANGVVDEAPASDRDEESPRPPSVAGAPPEGEQGPDRHRWVALGIAGLMLFPILARSGIWDPYELDAGDLARRIALHVFGAKSLDLPGALNVLPTLTDLRMGELPFTSMAVGFKLFGMHDWTGRLPLAVWGFAGVAVLYETVARLVDRRAGLYAALALVTMPLYFMQARTMLGDIVTMSALTLAFCGLLSAMLEARARWVFLGVGVVGLVAGYLSRGLLLGVATPALSVGLTWLTLRTSRDERDPETLEEAPAGDTDAVGALALAVGSVGLVLGLRALFKANPDEPLRRSVGFLIQRHPGTDVTFDLVVRQLGHALFPWSAFLPFALGRLFRAPVEARASARRRETGIRVALIVGSAVTYGAFALLAPRSGTLPYTAPALLAAAAGLALRDFERGASHSRAVSLGTGLLGVVLCADLVREPEKALAAFVVDRPQFPKTFESTGQVLMVAVFTIFVGVVALAWFDAQPVAAEGPASAPGDLAAWGRRVVRAYRDGAAELGRTWSGNLVFGLVVIEAALVGLGAMIYVGRRVGWAPVDKLPKLWADLGVNAWLVFALVPVVMPLVVVCVLDGFRALVSATRLSRASFAMIAALLSGGTMGFGYYPSLSAQLSPKEAFDAYARLAKPGEPLALLGVRSRAAAYYGGGDGPAFTDVNPAFAWLDERPNERRWILLKADDLPRTNSLFRSQTGKNLPILDGRSSQILLASNQLGDHPNESWLAKMVLDDPPPAGTTPIDFVFEDQIAATAWEVTDKHGKRVDSVVPSTTYHLRFYYRVLKPITGNWKAFVHIDGFQRRFNGDHNVLDGKYAMNLWHTGDILVDDFEFQLEPNFTPGGYTVYFGFFTGDNRFKVTRGQNHENRAIAGVLNVR
jgi:hypothetical protein